MTLCITFLQHHSGKKNLFISVFIDDPTVEGLDKSRNLQTGEMIIIVVVLLMWAGMKIKVSEFQPLIISAY